MNIKQLIACAGALVFCFLIGGEQALAATDNDLNVIESAGRGDLRIFKMMIEEGASPNALDKGNNSAILMAAYYSRRDMVRRLIELHGDANINVKGSIGYTPIGAASMRSDVEILKMLIQSGAKLDMRDDSGGTPLSNAIRFERDENVKALLEAGADMNIQCDEGETPLVLASRQGRLDYVDALLEKGADINPGEQGPLALYSAIYEGHDEIAQHLIRAGTSLHHLIYGYSPLHWATVMGRPTVVSQLKNMGVVD